MKHTPGPWKLFNSADGKCIILKGGAEGELECEIDTDDCCRDTALMNARLIAAAPDLLEALIELSECDFNERNCASFAVANKRIQAVAMKAIKKATTP